MNLEAFNDRQQEAIRTTEGPLLILAGAGSGKTTVVVNRIAYLLERGVRPWNILAITFTNKAAFEMKERVASLVGEQGNDIWVSTFHSSCVRILRRNIEKLGYESGFVIYDSQDQQTLIKECLKELNMDAEHFPPKMIAKLISDAKNDLYEPDVFCDIYASDFKMSKVGEVYRLYQKRLFAANALDFDDLIMQTVKLFSLEPEILSYYQDKFRYIFVDEYQDTNNSQYMLVSMLAGKHRNLCVVGDDDQSIYKFRGANINNILDFEKEFPDAKVIKLEQNYRSTQNILNAANCVIANNRGRKGKRLWTQNGDGGKITLYGASDERDEAYFIVEQIANKIAQEGLHYADFAILYRMNALSRVLEDVLLRNAIPYRVLGGLRFYDRKEIKDIVAYLRVIHNPNDNLSLSRIVNEPKRGIGDTTMSHVAAVADANSLSLYETMAHAAQIPELTKSAGKLLPFTQMMDSLRQREGMLSVSELIEAVLRESGYLDALTATKQIENMTRIENLKELVSSAVEYEKTAEVPSLGGFLEDIALVSDIDNYDADQDSVVLMTMHSAKGLEFPVVFLCGVEEGIFPSGRSIGEVEELEEERRLCYVGITRAKQDLFISHARYRMLFGKSQAQLPSRFIEELPSECLTDVSKPEPQESTVIPVGRRAGGQNFDALFRARPHRVAPQSVPAFDFREGDRVAHAKFGEGTIVAATPIGSDMKLTIDFDNAGRKNLMATFAKLTKL